MQYSQGSRNYFNQWRIQDFPQGRQTHRVLFSQNFLKSAWKWRKLGWQGGMRPKFVYVDRHCQWHALTTHCRGELNVWFTTGLFARNFRKKNYHEYLMAQEIWKKVPLLRGRVTERNWVGKVVCVSNFCAKVWREDWHFSPRLNWGLI